MCPTIWGFASCARNAHAHFNERHTDTHTATDSDTDTPADGLTKNKPSRVQLISRFIMRLQLECALCVRCRSFTFGGLK